MGTDLHRLGCSLVILSTILLYLARTLARSLACVARSCGRAGVRACVSLARPLARLLARSWGRWLLLARAGLWLALRACGRACRLLGCSAARSLARQVRNLSNKASDMYSYLRLLYLLKQPSFPVFLIVRSCMLKTFE